jgi:hypothetical protein
MSEDTQAEETKNMTLRLPTTLRERLAPIAKKNHRSLHGQIIAMLEEAAEREEGKKK